MREQSEIVVNEKKWMNCKKKDRNEKRRKSNIRKGKQGKTNGINEGGVSKGRRKRTKMTRDGAER